MGKKGEKKKKRGRIILVERLKETQGQKSATNFIDAQNKSSGIQLTSEHSEITQQKRRKEGR